MKSKVGYSIDEITQIGYDIDADKCADCGMSVEDEQLENLTNNNPEFVQEMAHDEIMGWV